MSDPSDPGVVPVPVPPTDPDRGSDSTSPGLPREAVGSGRPVRPTRRPLRTGDVALTTLFTAGLFVLVAVYVAEAWNRADTLEGNVPGAALANVLAEFAPIALAVFSSVFAAIFISRRILAFWLPVVAAILIVALYSVTQQMIDSAVVSHVIG